MTSAEYSQVDVRAHEERTRVFAVPSLTMAAPSLEQVLIDHEKALLELIRYLSPPEYLAVALQADDYGAAGAIVGAKPLDARGDAIIIGRHPRAGLHLPDDPSIALRHALLRTTLNAAGLPLVRLLDLQSSQGFALSQFGFCESVITAGSLVVQLASYTLVVLPVLDRPERWPAGVVEQWREGACGDVLDLRYLGERQARIWPVSKGEVVKPGIPITVLPGTSGLTHLLRAPPTWNEVIAVLRRNDRGNEVCYPLSAQQLELGVLLGRYERCDIGLETAGKPETVSRVHALLLKEGPRVFLFDLASTNGTLVNGQPVVCAELGHKAEIELSAGNLLVWSARAESALGA